MTDPSSDTFLGPDADARERLFHPVLLTLLEDNMATFTGIATIEFRRGNPVTRLPFRIIPTPEKRFMMTLVGRSLNDFVTDLDDFALWTPNYAEFFDLDQAHPVLLLDAFEQ